MRAHAGYVSGLIAPEMAETAIGASSFKARKAMFVVWQAMSPRAPVPKSHQPRQSCGWYAGFLSGCTAYGRSGAGPSHSSQCRFCGTGGVLFGRVM